MVTKKIKVTLIRGFGGRPENQRVVARTLGLTKRDTSVVLYDTPEIRGMINKIPHMLRVEDVEA
jgi:large subunit ribosomal protein L30